MGKQMVTLYDINTFHIGGRKVNVRKKIRQYYEFENLFVVRLDESDGNPNSEPVLLGIEYSNDNSIKWKFPYTDIPGISPEIPEFKKSEEFISEEHYKKYMEKFSGKELLIVYAGNFRYRIDANTGEVYDKMVSR